MAYGITLGSIAWTASETKNTEKKTGAITLRGSLPLGKIQVQIERSMSDTAGMVTVNVYNISKIDGTNSRDVFLTNCTVSTTVDYKAKDIEGAAYGTEATIKLGAVFAANITGSNGAGTLYYNIFEK